MANEQEAVLRRLKRAQGQINAVLRMVEEGRPCMDTLTQLAAAQGALAKAGERILGDHIQTCVAEAFTHGSPQARDEKVSELMDLFARYAGIGARP